MCVSGCRLQLKAARFHDLCRWWSHFVSSLFPQFFFLSALFSLSPFSLFLDCQESDWILILLLAISFPQSLFHLLPCSTLFPQLITRLSFSPLFCWCRYPEPFTRTYPLSLFLLLLFQDSLVRVTGNTFGDQSVTKRYFQRRSPMEPYIHPIIRSCIKRTLFVNTSFTVFKIHRTWRLWDWNSRSLRFRLTTRMSKFYC